MPSQQEIPVSRRHGGEKFALGMRIVSSEDARKGAVRQMSASVSGPAHTDAGQPSSTSSAQPREVMSVAVLAESELGSEAQRERRKRILDATMAIASKGGYEAVQMRAVADRADVAVGTLYRYFPSKVHLLVSALGREFERIDAKTDRSSLTGGTPFQRLNFMVSKLNRAMQRNPLLT
jgi:hypothetical protein